MSLPQEIKAVLEQTAPGVPVFPSFDPSPPDSASSPNYVWMTFRMLSETPERALDQIYGTASVWAVACCARRYDDAWDLKEMIQSALGTASGEIVSGRQEFQSFAWVTTDEQSSVEMGVYAFVIQFSVSI